MIGSLALSSVLFSMILGHWYLNISGLSIVYIKKSVLILTYIILVRLILNIFKFMDSVINLYGENIYLYDLIYKLEGIFLIIAFLFGIIGSFIINILTYKTVIIQATQSATGLLYINLVLILISDLC